MIVEPDNLEMQTVSMIRLLGEGMVLVSSYYFPCSVAQAGDTRYRMKQTGLFTWL